MATEKLYAKRSGRMHGRGDAWRAFAVCSPCQPGSPRAPQHCYATVGPAPGAVSQSVMQCKYSSPPQCSCPPQMQQPSCNHLLLAPTRSKAPNSHNDGQALWHTCRSTCINQSQDRALSVPSPPPAPRVPPLTASTVPCTCAYPARPPVVMPLLVLLPLPAVVRRIV